MNLVEPVSLLQSMHGAKIMETPTHETADLFKNNEKISPIRRVGESERNLTKKWESPGDIVEIGGTQ